jgi:hypothetical protein
LLSSSGLIGKDPKSGKHRPHIIPMLCKDCNEKERVPGNARCVECKRKRDRNYQQQRRGITTAQPAICLMAFEAIRQIDTQCEALKIRVERLERRLK